MQNNLNNYYHKYLKYKERYLKLKQKAGANPVPIQAIRYLHIYKFYPRQHYGQARKAIGNIAFKYKKLFKDVDELILPAYQEDLWYVDPVNKVTNWDEVVKYSLDYLLNNKSKYAFHQGAYANETSLIRDKLLKFYEYNVITTDSQPGLYIDTQINIESNPSLFDQMKENIYVQLPYVTIMGEKELLNLIIHKMLNHKYITCGIIEQNCVVDINLKQYFPNFESKGVSYGKCVFGMRVINEKDNPNEFFEYVFSQKFFDDLLEITSEESFFLINEKYSHVFNK